MRARERLELQLRRVEVLHRVDQQAERVEPDVDLLRSLGDAGEGDVELERVDPQQLDLVFSRVIMSE